MTDTRTPEQIADEMAAKYFKAKKPPRAARKNGHHHEAPPIEPDDPGPTSPENYGGNNRNRDSEATLKSLDNLEDESDHASKATYREGLPELLINDADPTATAKQLAALIAERGKFLSNGYAPVQIVVDGDGLPRALEVSIETVRVHGHEACNPTRERHTKTKGTRADSRQDHDGYCKAVSLRPRRAVGTQTISRDHDVADPARR